MGHISRRGAVSLPLPLLTVSMLDFSVPACVAAAALDTVHTYSVLVFMFAVCCVKHSKNVANVY